MTATAQLAICHSTELQLEREDVPNVMDRRFPAVYTNYAERVIYTDDDVLNEWEVFAGIAKRNNTKITLPGGELPISEDLTDSTVIDYVYGNARLPMSLWRENKRTIHHDNPIKVLPGDPQNDARFAVCPDDVYANLLKLAERSGSELLDTFDKSLFPYLLVGRRLKHALNSLGQNYPDSLRSLPQIMFT